MSTEKPSIDYAAILADLEAKKVALEQSIIGIRAGLKLGVLGAAGEISSNAAQVVDSGGPVSGFPVDLPVGAFLGMNIPAAIKLYLSSARAKKTNREITQALEAGGLEANSKLDALVNSAIFRMKSSGEILRFKEGWGLKEWAPAGFRPAVAETPKKKGKKKQTNGTKNKAANPSNPKTPARDKSISEEIMEFLAASVNSHAPEAIMTAVGSRSIAHIKNTLSKLVKEGKIDKRADGLYSVDPLT
ncbi:MAG TPA: hypothetical protein VGK48_11530 [Terriglobia bacterium]|jgi:hypothetical protein